MKWMIKTTMILALAFLTVAGFATVMPHLAIAAQDSIKAPAAKIAAIKSISTTGEGASTELVINLSSPATYTSYKTTAPLRLVIDFSQASEGSITVPQIINKGNFKTVTANRFDTDAGVLTRIDIELDKDAEAVISASPIKPGELRVSFPALSGNPMVVSPPPLDAKPAIESAIAAQAPISTSTSQVTASVRKLKSISVDSGKITLAVDGGVADFNSFRLNKPERFVIDLMDTQLDMSSRLIPLNSSGVASARIGLYPEKVRVVLDSVNGVFPEATTLKTSQGLTVTLGNNPNENHNTKLLTTRSTNSTDDPAKSVKIAQNADQSSVPDVKSTQMPVTEPKATILAKPNTAKKRSMPAGIEPASVEMIDFQVVENISRVAIKVKGDVFVEPPIKTPGFVTLTIKNAGLSKQLQRSLETQSFVTPVLRITPLLVKSRKGTDTKIRIAMRTVAPYEFRQEGDMFFVDFKNPEGLPSEKLPEAIIDNNPLTSQNNKSIKYVGKKSVKEHILDTQLDTLQDSSLETNSTLNTYKGRKVTLEFADADVRKIFQLLSEVSNRNFVLGDEVTGNISLKLVNVPWDQALDIILETKGFEKKIDSNIVMIRGAGKLKSQIDSEAEKRVAQMKSGKMVTKNVNIFYSNSDDVALALKPLVKHEWQGSVTSDKRTNTVIINAVEQLIDDMMNLIKVIDKPERQVMIEARIIEASSTFVQSLGVNWGIHANDPTAGYILGIKNFNTGFGGLASTPPPTSGVTGQPGGTMGISFGSIFGSNVSLDMRLNAAASAGMIKIISTPKVATLNNKSAKITQGQQVPYTSSTSDKVETKFIEAALSLEVTPHINSNGTISMKIDAKNDSVGQATGGSTAPAINKKQATTEMLMRDGETTVIGGIYVDSDNESNDGVPYLMDIPLIGKLFKSTQKSKVKTEMIIFITPKILADI